jgi:hypothetical protein
MAWLELNGDGFRIGFRFGKKHHFRLDTVNQKEANATLGRFESNFRLIEQGVIDAPPDGADLGTYIVSGGKLGLRPSEVERVEPKTLADLFDNSLAHYPKAAKEKTTWKVERIHIGHFRRLFDTKLPLIDVTTRTLQDYVEARCAVE